MAEEENKDVPYFRATSWMGEAGDTVYERIRDPAWLSGSSSEEGEWSSGLCDCFSDCRKCIISIVPIINTLDVAYTYNVMDGKDGLTGEICCGIVLPAASICTGTCALLACIQIFVVRSKFHDAPYNIKPTCTGCPLVCEDIMCAFCCGWCAIQQCQRHLDGIQGGLPAYLFAPDHKNTMNEGAKDV